MTTNLTIGERVAWYRRRRGMSQEVLAGLVGRTVDWLSKAENNRIELDRLSVIKSLADALDVTLGDLLAEPTLLDWTADSGRRTVPALRSALMNYRQLTPLLGVTTEGEPTPLDELRSSVAEVWDAYQDSRYAFATRRLPLLLADALIAAQAYEGREREQAHELMAMTYQGAAMVLTKLGEADLAWIAADRGLAAAQQSGNAVVTGSLSVLSPTACCPLAGSIPPRSSSVMRGSTCAPAWTTRTPSSCRSTAPCSSPDPWRLPGRRTALRLRLSSPRPTKQPGGWEPTPTTCGPLSARPMSPSTE
jgi:transcriptional regulator with XRE-family HTH domain